MFFFSVEHAHEAAGGCKLQRKPKSGLWQRQHGLESHSWQLNGQRALTDCLIRHGAIRLSLFFNMLWLIFAGILSSNNTLLFIRNFQKYKPASIWLNVRNPREIRCIKPNICHIMYIIYDYFRLSILRSVLNFESLLC